MENLLFLGVPILKHFRVLLFYTTLIIMDLGQYEIFCAEFCDFGKSRINFTSLARNYKLVKLMDYHNRVRN